MNDVIDTWISYLNMMERKGEKKVSLFHMRAILRRLKAMEAERSKQ